MQALSRSPVTFAGAKIEVEVWEPWLFWRDLESLAVLIIFQILERYSCYSLGLCDPQGLSGCISLLLVLQYATWFCENSCALLCVLSLRKILSKLFACIIYLLLIRLHDFFYVMPSVIWFVH